MPLAIAAPRTLARAPRSLSARPGPPPTSQRPAAELAAAAQSAGADVRSGPDFMEISFPPPAGAAPATVARTAAGSSTHGLAPAAAPRTLGGAASGAVLARAAQEASFSPSGGSGTDGVVEAVLRAMREENEHLGILDGIDPLY